jgi:hypothetical protein
MEMTLTGKMNAMLTPLVFKRAVLSSWRGRTKVAPAVTRLCRAGLTDIVRLHQACSAKIQGESTHHEKAVYTILRSCTELAGRWLR